MGFGMKSNAPTRIAFTAISMSPCAERKTMGAMKPRRTSSACSYGPVMPGIFTSSTKQPGSLGASPARKLSASG